MTTQLPVLDEREGHIPCPSCGSTLTMVKDSRGSRMGSGIPAIRRRRMCPACSQRFTTFEVEQELLERTMRVHGAKAQWALRIVDMIEEEVRAEMVKRLTGSDVTPRDT